MDEMAKEIENALNKDAVATMPKAAALHLKPNGGAKVPTCSDDIDRLIERLHSTIKGLEMLKGQL